MAATPEGRISFALDMLKHGTDRAIAARTEAGAKIAATTDGGEFYRLSSFHIDALVEANANLELWANLAAELTHLNAAVHNAAAWLPVVVKAAERETANLVDNRHESRSTSSGARMMGDAARDAAAKFVRELNSIVAVASKEV